MAKRVRARKREMKRLGKGIYRERRGEGELEKEIEREKEGVNRRTEGGGRERGEEGVSSLGKTISFEDCTYMEAYVQCRSTISKYLTSTRWVSLYQDG